MKSIISRAGLLAFGIASISLAEDTGADRNVRPNGKKTDAGSLFHPMVKMVVTELQPEAKDSLANVRFVATELEIEDLWETLGIQIFELTSGPDSGHEIFIYSSGELKKLPICADHGVPDAAVSDGSLYFTCKSGSGISCTILNKVSRGQDKTFTHETLGTIDAQPVEYVDKEVVEKMRDVIRKLKPVKKGASTDPAPAPGKDPAK